MDNQIQIVNPQSEEVFSMAEAALQLGITSDAFREYIKKHKETLEPYISKRIHLCKISGLERRMTVITKECFVGIAKFKNLPSSNQFEKRHGAPFLSQQAKIQSQENTIQQMASLMQTTMEELRSFREERKIVLAENIKEATLNIVDDLTQSKITREQKKILDDMAKVVTFTKLGIKPGDKYDQFIFSRNISDLRKYMNAYIGRKKIDNYTHLDYIKAWKYLKKLT